MLVDCFIDGLSSSSSNCHDNFSLCIKGMFKMSLVDPRLVFRKKCFQMVMPAGITYVTYFYVTYFYFPRFLFYFILRLLCPPLRYPISERNTKRLGRAVCKDSQNFREMCLIARVEPKRIIVLLSRKNSDLKVFSHNSTNGSSLTDLGLGHCII